MLAVAEAAAASSAVLALLSCCTTAAYSVAGQGLARPLLAVAKPKRSPSLSPPDAAPLTEPSVFPCCSVPV